MSAALPRTDPASRPAAAIDVRMLGPRDLPLVAGAPPDLVGEAGDPAIAQAILADPRRFVAAAIAGGRLVGIASGVRTSEGDARSTLVLRDVAVASGHRRKGVGRRLVAVLLAHARASGCRGASIEAARDDVALLRLCAAAGAVERPDPVVRLVFPLT